MIDSQIDHRAVRANNSILERAAFQITITLRAMLSVCVEEFPPPDKHPAEESQQWLWWHIQKRIDAARDLSSTPSLLISHHDGPSKEPNQIRYRNALVCSGCMGNKTELWWATHKRPTAGSLIDLSIIICRQSKMIEVSLFQEKPQRLPPPAPSHDSLCHYILLGRVSYHNDWWW